MWVSFRTTFAFSVLAVVAYRVQVDLRSGSILTRRSIPVLCASYCVAKTDNYWITFANTIMVRKRRNLNKNSIQNVRVVDTLAGSDGARVDRQLAHMQNTANHIQVQVSDSFPIDSSPAGLTAILDWRAVRQFDDFVSMAGQFNTYRIRSIRFDVYDISPGVIQPAYFSSFHDEYNSGNVPVFTIADVIDGIDSQMVPPGTGKIQFSWVGHTTNERGYYDVSPASGAAPDFGGLRYSLVAVGGVASTKFRISVKAIVDFRGRR